MCFSEPLGPPHTFKCNGSLQKLFQWTVSSHKAHLSKGLSDLKQNGTQEKTPFSGTVSHCLSCGVVLFVQTVSFWNHQIEASHWLKEEFCLGLIRHGL